MEGRNPDINPDLDQLVRDSPLSRVNFVAWRDLDDPEAGGSELHAHRIAIQWAAAGLEITMRTSRVPNGAQEITRDGYQVIRKHGRYAVFPRVINENMATRRTSSAGLVEIWNGMPFFSPLWFHGPRLIFIHHVHAEMWKMVMPRHLAMLGNTIERNVAPLFYRSSTIATPSESSRQEIIEMLQIPAENVHVVHNGVDDHFRPGDTRRSNAHVVAVGRLVPVKAFDRLIELLVSVKQTVPDLTASIVGEGYERPALEALRDRLGASDWISMPGRISDEALIAEYQSAWLVASTSLREGWGMSLTEAAACGTPSVASDIAGHRDAVLNHVSGVLVLETEAFDKVLRDLLTTHDARKSLEEGALRYAQELSWQKTAIQIFELLSPSSQPRET